MTCPNEFICTQFADGELPEAEARRVAEHLEMCPACQALVDAFTQENRLLVQSFQDIEAWELEHSTEPAVVTQPVSIARFALFISGLAAVLRLGFDIVFGFKLPAGLEWIDPRGWSVSLGIVINAVPYAIENGGPVMANTIQGASIAAVFLLVFVGMFRFVGRNTAVSTVFGALVLLVVFSSSSYALDVRKASGTTVPAGTTVEDTLIVYGAGPNGDVIIDGIVKGDVIAIAPGVIIRGTIEGDLITAARRIDMSGTVGGNIFGFGQTIQISGQVARNLYGFGQTVMIERPARVGGNATTFTEDTDIEGTVGIDVTSFSGNLNIRGDVARNVVYGGGHLSVIGPARVGGGLDARVGRMEDVQIDAGASITGNRNIQLRPPEPVRYATVRFYVRQVLRLAAAFLTGLVLFWLFPWLATAAARTGNDWLKAGGIGFAAAILIPVAAFIVGITLIGLPIAIGGLILWIAGLYISKIIVAEFLGRSLVKDGRVLPLLMGLVVVVIAVNLPYVGGLINILLMVLGLGALLLVSYRNFRWRPAAL